MPLPLFLGLAAAAAAGAGVIKKQAEKSKAIDAALDEAKTACCKEALSHKPERTETEFQKAMFDLLFNHGFSYEAKQNTPPIESDWKHLPKHTQLKAAKKYSSFSWAEYSFYTFEAVYYHHKKKAIHELLYYDRINFYDSASETVDYGAKHEKRVISHWGNFEKLFVNQVARIWKMDENTDTSVLEFCFNHCDAFCAELSFFKTSSITNAFRKQCKGRHGTLQKYFDHLRIKSMNDGKITLQYWYYFPRVENVSYSENDTDDDIREKEWEQERREREAEEREEKAYRAHELLLGLSDDIAEVFQKALFNLYGVLFKKENISLIEEPDYTYEGTPLIERVENAATSFNAFVQDYAAKHNK